MPLFDQTLPVAHEEVAEIVQTNWNLKLGKLIKASQNHTFEAISDESDGTITKYVVRVTPDPHRKHHARISDEIFFVNYLVNSNKIFHICAPKLTLSGEFVVKVADLVIIVSEWAKGNALDFMSYTWMVDKDFVFIWGKWLAEFHKVSREFSVSHPDIATRIQRWDEMHDGILKDSAIHEDDEAVMSDLEHYGIIHGDLNLSNFYYIAPESQALSMSESATLSVFDWDQTQQGWYLWDVAQSLLAVYMLHEAGSLIDGSEVAQANPVQFEAWLVAGYESVSGPGTLDRERLQRMVNLRKHFYEKFCRTASEQGSLPKDMEYFVNYVVKWFDKLRAIIDVEISSP